MVRNEVIKYTSYNPYVDAIFYRVTHNIADVPIEHFRREYGSSNYTFRKLVRLWLAYFNFSTIPLRISSYLGILFSVTGFIGAVAVIIRQIIAPSAQIGWASLMCVMCFFFGLSMLALGILGEYMGKIMLSISHTPQYIVREVRNTEKKDEP